MKRAVTLSLGMLLVAGFLMIPGSAAAHCGINTGHFCAYVASQYQGDPNPRLHSAAGLNQEVDVADNVVSSGKNGTGNYWRGMNEHTFLPDECVFYWAPHTAVSYVGNAANDKIDHFSVKSSGC